MCPDNWHIPSDADYIELEIFFGMSSEDVMKIGWDRGSDQGSKLKDDFNWNGTNESGLSVVPGGFRAFNWGTDYDIENNSFLWTSSDANIDNSYGRSFSLDDSTIARNTYPKNNGFSVRCIADIPGCMHPNGTNYDPNANVDDGSCEYELAQIGHQVWMNENLKTTNYLNGDEIGTGYNHQEWIALNEGAFAFVDNDILNTDLYGILYNGYAVNDDRGICPDRWHMPTESDWNQLILFLDNNADTTIINGTQSLIAGGKMKSIGTIDDGDGFFRSPNIGATNESGFNAVPGGFVGGDETEIYFGSQNALYWTYDSYYFRNVTYSSEKIDIGIWSENPMAWGISVRCLQDQVQPTTIVVPENFPTIQEAIDYSIDGDTILVSAGTYYENINFNGKNIALIGENRETTIIDGVNTSLNMIVLQNVNNTTLLKGFTIRNGSYGQSGTILISQGSHPTLEDLIIDNNICNDCEGGGVFINDNSSSIISNCIIRNNSAEKGGGIFVENASVEIYDSIIKNNISLNEGGGIYINNGIANIYNSSISNNLATSGGGGLKSLNSEIIISNSNFNNNSSYRGGGILSDGGIMSIYHSLLKENFAEVGETALSFYGGFQSLINCTIANNYGPEQTAIHSERNELNIKNSVIYGNSGNNYIAIGGTGGSALYVSYSLIEGGQESILSDTGIIYWLEGNISEDPQFNDDFTLQSSSPCIDAGDPNSTLDLDGTIADMGTYFFDQDPPIYGCNNELACNYDSNVTDNDGSCEYPSENYDCDGNCLPELIDCNGNCAGNAVFDNCGVCDNNPANDCIQDCTGEWGGDAEIDECGICDSSLENNCFSYSLHLNPGANLKSFYALPVNDSISNIFISMSESVSGVITEGGAANQISPGLWVGSIRVIDPLKGYWIITVLEEGQSLIINDAIAMDVNSEYNLHIGANLISYPSRNSNSLEYSFSDDIELFITGIITDGAAASQISPGVWVGSLDEFEAGKGYWFISSSNIKFSYIID